jgi:aspartate/methionine/tyrosine aminotransferase
MSSNLLFDIERDAPFLAFRKLREVAEANVGEANILDLSQGEPGYGFSPNVRSRKFFAFLLVLDTALNDHLYKKTLFSYREASEIDEINKKIKEVAFDNYKEEIATKLLADFEIFITRLQEICEKQKLEHDRFKILYELFKYSNLSGGRYPQPFGQTLLQAVNAEEYSEILDLQVWHDELIAVMGASHGIGAVFKGLGSEGIKYLHGGDSVLMTSPVYAPYNLMFKQRGINVLSLSINPITGEFDPIQIKKIKKSKNRIKAIVLIDPNNPTGFGADETFFKAIIEIAETHNSVIVTDEVYLRFFENKKSIISMPAARKRLIRIDSISKIERSTGVRSGNIYLSKEANKFLSTYVLDGYLGDYDDLFHLLRFAKSPGGKNIGLFQHITGIPGPSVGMTLAHLILGKEERKKATEMIDKKMRIFYENISQKYTGNFYYGMLNLRDFESEAWKDRHVTEKMKKIAENGVVVMPANLFFSEYDRDHKDCTHFIRVSLPNLSFKNTKKAAEIIRDSLK